MAANVTRAALPATAEEHDVVERMRQDGLAPYRWSNGPFDSYAAHSHAYHKVLYCARGSIRFDIAGAESVELQAGDRLDLEPRSEHSALVGPNGVVCFEAQR